MNIYTFIRREKEGLVCFDAAFLFEHVFHGRIRVVIPRTVRSFSSAGKSFDRAELQAGKAAFTGMQPLFFSMGQRPDVVYRADPHTYQASVAGWADDKFFVEQASTLTVLIE